MRRCLVTGASGFIGQHLCNYFIHNDIGVRRAVRDDSTGADDIIDVGDIDAKTDWSKALDGCDYVVHLAARVHVMCENSGNPLSAYRNTNVEGTRNLVSQSISAGVKRIHIYKHDQGEWGGNE